MSLCYSGEPLDSRHFQLAVLKESILNMPLDDRHIILPVAVGKTSEEGLEDL